MRHAAELEALWQSSPPLPIGRGTVRLICVRTSDGVHDCPPRVTVCAERGVVGDRWAGAGKSRETQITLMTARVAELVAAGVAPLHAPGDNFLVDLDLSEAALPAGTELRLGGALVVVSPHPHAGCKKFLRRFGIGALTWVNDDAGRARRMRGVNCRVLSGGEVSLGDAIELA